MSSSLIPFQPVLGEAHPKAARCGLSTFPKQIDRTERSRRTGRETRRASSSLYVRVSDLLPTVLQVATHLDSKTGLFAATVAAFIVESYKRLSADTGSATVLLLNQISQQLSALSGGAQIPPPPLYSDSSFRPTSSSIRVNILWFLSLTLSLICALAATLMQQWARRYLQLAQSQTTLHKRARTREYLFEGVQAFRLSQAVEAVPALLHVAVFLFFAGLVDFLFSIDSTVGRVIFGVMCFFGGIYVLLTFLPNVRPNCPYRTPFSRDSLKWFLVFPTAPAFVGIYSLRCILRHEVFEMVQMRFLLFVQSLLWTISDAMRSHQENIERRALQWAVATVDDDDDIETLVEGIPGYLTDGTSRNALSITQDLLDPQQPTSLGRHISRLIITCTPEGYRSASEGVRRRRALICLDTTRFLTGVYYASFSYGMFGYQTWPSVNSLKRDEDPVISINAVCTGALAARAYLRSIFVDGPQAPAPAPAPTTDHAQKLFELVNAPWPKDSLYSLAGCHLLVLHGFVSALLPHLSSNDTAPTSFRAVWETLPRILNKAPRGSNVPEPHIRRSFLAVWTELGNLAGSEPPVLPWGSALVSGSEPLRFKKSVMDAVGFPPVVQLMSMLRPSVESLRAQDAASQEGQNAQDAQEGPSPAVPASSPAPTS